MTSTKAASPSGITELQESENKTNIAVHQEKISSLEKALEKTSADIEDRLRQLEKFKYITVGTALLTGIILSSLIQWFMKASAN